jgi:cell division protein FtsN
VPAPNGNPAPAKRFTVQVAAYQTREAADQLINRLSARGITARVIGSSAPYRVRIGHYATDADATAAARELKGKGIEGFVTTTDNEGAPPRVPR